MIDCDDYVSLSDDDNVVEVTSKSASSGGNNDKGIEAIETIVIDEDLDQPITSASRQTPLNSFIQIMKKIQQEHSAFALFIDTCLDLENSDGMMRIIERTLIKLYEQCDSDYKNSPQFLGTINKTISLLEADPDHKFSHIKNFVHAINAKKSKKRVELLTLATNLKGKHTPGLVSKSKQRIPESINNNDSIVIDSDDEQQIIPTINLDDTPNNVIGLDSVQTEKENHRIENCPSNNHDNCLIPQEEVLYESSQVTLTFVEPKVLPIVYEPISNVPPSNLREPHSIKQVLQKVEAFEGRINYLKTQIAVLEEMEVNDDSATSPYVMCESYKGEVVELYKEICHLIGEQPIKQRKVRLKVLEGHPLGPVMRLETFINNNIGEDGLPLFPDYSEVLKCVMVANLEDKMGWKRQQIMKEANALFTQCGRALQQKRQKREYRDLLARLKTDYHDPADDDPELQRRLEQNRRTAVKKELDLIERYAQLQDLPQPSRSGSTFERLSPTNLGPSASNHANENEHHIRQLTEQYEKPCLSSHEQEHEPIIDISGITPATQKHPLDQKEDKVKELEPVCNGNDRIEPESTCNGIVPDENESSEHIDQSNPSPCSDIILSDEDSNFEPPEIHLSLEIKEENLVIGTSAPETENKDTVVKKEVKKEPMDIIKMLEDIGDDYTTSVIDIEDPLLVIEISSDSSDSDDDEMDCEEI